MNRALETDGYRVGEGERTFGSDRAGRQRPLEMRVRAGGAVRVISTTMRTPGEDRALAAGFLFAAQVISGGSQIRSIDAVADDAVLVDLIPEVEGAVEALRRPFAVAGGRDREAVEEDLALPPMGEAASGGVPGSRAGMLATVLQRARAAFGKIRGLHVAGLFSAKGAAEEVHEDVGDHNAVDKLVGSLILQRRLPDADSVLVLSGRASLGLVEKAAGAGIPIMCALGAHSRLAVELARGAGMTFLGFTPDDGFTVYCGAQRLGGMR